jgi:hypothetical protein
MQTGSSEVLIGWKSGNTTIVPPWERMVGSVAMDSGQQLHKWRKDGIVQLWKTPASGE